MVIRYSLEVLRSVQVTLTSAVSKWPPLGEFNKDYPAHRLAKDNLLSFYFLRRHRFTHTGGGSHPPQNTGHNSPTFQIPFPTSPKALVSQDPEDREGAPDIPNYVLGEVKKELSIEFLPALTACDARFDTMAVATLHQRFFWNNANSLQKKVLSAWYTPRGFDACIVTRPSPAPPPRVSLTSSQLRHLITVWYASIFVGNVCAWCSLFPVLKKNLTARTIANPAVNAYFTLPVKHTMLQPFQIIGKVMQFSFATTKDFRSWFTQIKAPQHTQKYFAFKLFGVVFAQYLH